MENKTLELKIPEKVSDHQYVIQGIGKQEMTILIIQFLGAIGADYSMCNCRKYYSRIMYWGCNSDNHVLFVNKRQCK